MTLKTLADVRALIEKHLPKDRRARPERFRRAPSGAVDRGQRVSAEVKPRSFPPPWTVEEAARPPSQNGRAPAPPASARGTVKETR
jgi:hypothetical protein